MSVNKLIIALLSILSIVLLSISFFLDIDSEPYKLLNYYDYALCAFFLYDFLVEFIKSKNRIKYFFTYGWIDLLSSIPVIHELRFARAFRVFRIFRIFRSLKFLIQYLRSNKKESFYGFALVFIILVIIISSFFVLYFEQFTGNITTAEETLWWTFITITTVGYGDFYPISTGGRLFAFLLIVSGVFGFGAIIAYLNDKINPFRSAIRRFSKEIEKYFKSTYKKRPALGKYKATLRYFTFQQIQSRFTYSHDEIIECIRSSANLRFRAMKSSDTIKYSDIQVVERFLNNTSYGSKIINSKSNIYIINPMGASERCISHYTHTIVDNLGYNYLSREIRLRTKNEEAIASNYSKYYADFEKHKAEFNIDFIDFIDDIKQIKEKDFVIVLCSGAADRGDFIIEYGNKKGDAALVDGISTVYDKEKLEQFISVLKTNTENFKCKVSKAKEEVFSFNIENHSIGNYHNKWIGKFIHNQTGANVVTLYVNIKHLTGEDKLYFASLQSLMKSMEEVFGCYK